jgi:hypothetical protein
VNLNLALQTAIRNVISTPIGGVTFVTSAQRRTGDGRQMAAPIGPRPAATRHKFHHLAAANPTNRMLSAGRGFVDNIYITARKRLIPLAACSLRPCQSRLLSTERVTACRKRRDWHAVRFV